MLRHFPTQVNWGCKVTVKSSVKMCDTRNILNQVAKICYVTSSAKWLKRECNGEIVVENIEHSRRTTEVPRNYNDTVFTMSYIIQLIKEYTRSPIGGEEPRGELRHQ
jgi:hypothetical protein